MNKHPKHDTIAALLRDGAKQAEITLLCKVSRDAVSQVRKAEGIPVQSRARSVEWKISTSLQDVESDGHMLWTGYTNHGTPIIRHKGTEIAAAAVIFERRTGRAPVGNVSTECGWTGRLRCLAPGHIADDTERQKIRRQQQAMLGLAAPHGECHAGHDQTVHGAIEPDLSNYCRTCNENRSAKRRKRNS